MPGCLSLRRDQPSFSIRAAGRGELSLQPVPPHDMIKQGLQSTMKNIYRSKIDAWLVIVLVVSMGIMLASVSTVLLSSPEQGRVVVLVSLVLAVGLPAWVFMSTRYVVSRRQLRVQCGPFRWKIPVADIVRITPSNSPLASPALSLDRLRIEYGSGKSLLVSPRLASDFIRDLEAQAERSLFSSA